MKHPVFETEEFTLYLEDVNGNMFIHCDVWKPWTKTLKNNLGYWFNKLTEVYGKEIFALHAPEDKKHEKFLKLFKFSYLMSIKGTDGNDYDIYIWR